MAQKSSEFLSKHFKNIQIYFHFQLLVTAGWPERVLLGIWRASPWLLPSSQGHPSRLGPGCISSIVTHVSRQWAHCNQTKADSVNTEKCFPTLQLKRPQICVRYYQNKIAQISCGIFKKSNAPLVTVCYYFSCPLHVGHSCKVLRHNFFLKDNDPAWWAILLRAHSDASYRPRVHSTSTCCTPSSTTSHNKKISSHVFVFLFWNRVLAALELSV